MVSTKDSDSFDPSSILGKTFFIRENIMEDLNFKFEAHDIKDGHVHISGI